MNKFLNILKNIVISSAIIMAAFGINYLLRFVLDIRSMVPMIYVLGVFFISLCTEGYFYGIVSAGVSAILVDLLFYRSGSKLVYTYDIIAASIIIFVVALLTCTLTSMLKKDRKIRATSATEHMRANLMRAVSHDLRTPLTSIYASSSAILDSFDSLNDEQRLALVSEIREESQGLIRMVENLLSVTRINGDDVKVTKTPTVLEELVDAVVVKYNRHFPEMPLEVDIPDEFVSIPMDAMLIKQVLFNILENAVVHAEGMTRLLLRVTLKKDKAVFEISDDGCGIPEEKLNRIFDGYFAAVNDSHRTNRRNMGIGLNVCSAIIKAHGGRIYAVNNSMGGTSFYFTLERETENEQ